MGEVVRRVARAVLRWLQEAAANSTPPFAPPGSLGSVAVTSRRRRRDELDPWDLHPSAPACSTCNRYGCEEHCPWCGGNLHAGSHNDDCPWITNVYPVARGEVTECWACGADLEWGASYSYIETGFGEDVWVAVCLGCAARSELGIGFT